MKKIFLLSLVGVLAVGALVSFVGQKVQGQSNPLIQPMSAVNPILNFDVLNILGSLERAQIDSAFFESALFRSLEDFSLQVLEEPVGRKDPFASPDSTQ